MQVVIFGASGTVGRHLVNRALAEGHQVTAFARRPEVLAIKHDRLGLHAGDVMDPGQVAQAVVGQDAVIIALGAGLKGQVRSRGTAHIIAAMQNHDVKRLLCLSTLGAGDSRGNLNFFWKRIMFGLLLSRAYADHQVQERLVRQSGLDWTLVRPGAFTDGPPTGQFKYGFPSTERNLALKISRADVAGFMVGQLAGKAFLRHAPGLSY